MSRPQHIARQRPRVAPCDVSAARRAVVLQCRRGHARALSNAADRSHAAWRLVLPCGSDGRSRRVRPPHLASQACHGRQSSMGPPPRLRDEAVNAVMCRLQGSGRPPARLSAGLAILPYWMSWLTTRSTAAIGISNPTPAEVPGSHGAGRTPHLRVSRQGSRGGAQQAASATFVTTVSSCRRHLQMHPTSGL